MKNKTLEPKTPTQPSRSPYQAERAEIQQTPTLRPDPLAATLAPPGSEATIRAHAAGLTPATAGRTMRRLQRQYGNRYVQRVVELVQRRGGGEGFQLDDETAGRINRARGGGQQLDGVVQAQMSEALGYNFSGVRVHTDPEAHTLNRLLSARAFTTGHDIFFRRGEYNPGSGRGRELITHELTHVVQQSSRRVSGSGSGMTVRPTGDVFEQEADAQAQRVSDHRRNANAIDRHRDGDVVCDTPPAVGQAHFIIQREDWEQSPGGTLRINKADRTVLHVYQDISHLDVADTLKTEKESEQHWLIRANVGSLSGEVGEKIKTTCDDFAQWLTSKEYKEEDFKELKGEFADLKVGDVINVSVATGVDLPEFHAQKEKLATRKDVKTYWSTIQGYEHPAGTRFPAVAGKPPWVSYHFTTVVAKAGDTVATCEVNKEYQFDPTKIQNPWFNLYKSSNALITHLRDTYTLKKAEAAALGNVWRGVVKKVSTR